MELTNLLTDPNQPTRPGMIPGPTGRGAGSTNSFARVIVWHWKEQLFLKPTNITPEGNIGTVETWVFEREIDSITTAKALGSASGNFEITLFPTINWKNFISPGDWIAIYFYNSKREAPTLSLAKMPEQPFQNFNPLSLTTDNISMVGNVDRIALTKERDDKTDKIITRYHIIGRDIGKVLEDTDIFFNPYCMQFQNGNAINVYMDNMATAKAGTPAEHVQGYTGVFLNGKPFNLSDTWSGDVNLSIAPFKQWHIPTEMVALFATSIGATTRPTALDIMTMSLADLSGYSPRATFDSESGGALWDLLVRVSNPVVNELWVDTFHDGKAGYPRLNLRARPQSPFSNSLISPEYLSYKISIGPDNWQSLIELAKKKENVVLIRNDDIRFENMGKNHQTTFNLLWLRPKMAGYETALMAEDNMKIGLPGQIGLPIFLGESIRRYGLKRITQSIDFCYSKMGYAANKDVELTKAFALQKWDQVAFNHLYENGTMETAGCIDASIGKVLKVDPGKQNTVPARYKTKLYYVEGYSHKWKFPGMWTTEWTLSGGIFDDNLQPLIDVRDIFGQDDKYLQDTVLSKTTIVNPTESINSGLEKAASVVGALGGAIA
jgi:hypothetical protein